MPPDTSKKLVGDVLTPHMLNEVWKTSYYPVLPLMLSRYSISALLPAVFYMFRRGHRRGVGRFSDVYGKKDPSMHGSPATVERVASGLAEQSAWFEGFHGDLGQAILGDLLLSFCLENEKRFLGRSKQIQRVFPVHYMASWVDLPPSVSNLRLVPELIVTTLVNRTERDRPELTPDRDRTTWFPLGAHFLDNALLKPFLNGISLREGAPTAGLHADDFNEAEKGIGLDELLMVRLAQSLGSAPKKLSKGSPQIENNRPLATRASRAFHDDLRIFFIYYGDRVPRQGLVPLLESGIALGLSNIFLSTLPILAHWEKTGIVLPYEEQEPFPLFMDGSRGIDRELQRAAEDSFLHLERAMERIPVTLMALRLLDFKVRNDRIMKDEIESTAAVWIGLLGEILHGRHPRSERILDDLDEKCSILSERLTEEEPDAATLFRDTSGEPNPVLRLAEGLCILMGRNSLWSNYHEFLHSCLATGEPNGLALSRKTWAAQPGEGRRRRDLRSLALSDSALDFLVHRHLAKDGQRPRKNLSFGDFLEIIREKYGFYVEDAPPSMTVSRDILLRNRVVVEKRLRDLGVLVGVNDAEDMKRLRPRFGIKGEEYGGR